jgi:cytochrome c peroxidase
VSRYRLPLVGISGLIVALSVFAALAQQRPTQQRPTQQRPPRQRQEPQPSRRPTPRVARKADDVDRPARPADAVEEAQTPREVREKRPEQRQTDHDRSKRFESGEAQAITAALKDQPRGGENTGFDFYRDPLNSDKPMTTFEQVRKHDMAEKEKVMEEQHRLLAKRYDLKPRLDDKATMSRGKPLAVGPTARLPKGVEWDDLAQTSPGEIRKSGHFPYPSLPHPKHTTGGQVFPPMQLEMFPRLKRFDVEHDLPEAFLPEFPPAIFLSNRPELGDVSRGEVVSINNYYRLFKDILTPVQLDGLRMLLTPFPEEEFNPTDDRKSDHPSLGVTCFDCHINGHTTGQFHLSPDERPERRRFRLDTVSLRGLFNQQIHGSKRSLRSVEDFTEFEFRTAYFNGDPIHAMKKGFTIIPRIQVTHMAQLQNMLDFPPAPKLDRLGRLIESKASEAELRGEKLFFGKAKCAECHPAPFYLDQQMHDLRLEEFLDEPGDGPTAIPGESKNRLKKVGLANGFREQLV